MKNIIAKPHPSNPDDERFAQRLREDAGPRPAFSPLVHERIMSALKSQTGGTLDATHLPSVPYSPWQRAFRIAMPTAIAAMVAIAAWIVLQPPAAPTTDTPFKISNTQMPMLPRNVVEPVTDVFVTPTTTAINDAKYAYLDKDAQRLALFVAEQIPSFPSLPQK